MGTCYLTGDQCFDDVATTQKIDVGNCLVNPTHSIPWQPVLHMGRCIRVVTQGQSRLYRRVFTSIIPPPSSLALDVTPWNTECSPTGSLNWLYIIGYIMFYDFSVMNMLTMYKRSENQSLLPDAFFPQVIAQSDVIMTVMGDRLSSNMCIKATYLSHCKLLSILCIPKLDCQVRARHVCGDFALVLCWKRSMFWRFQIAGAVHHWCIESSYAGLCFSMKMPW